MEPSSWYVCQCWLSEVPSPQRLRLMTADTARTSSGPLQLVVEKVIVSPNDLEVRLRANGIERLVLELQPAGAAQPEEALA